MFTNTDFIATGKEWLPRDKDLCKRLEIAKNGRQLYDGEFMEVFGDVWDTIGTRYGLSYAEIEQVLVKINLFKTLTDSFKTLAFMKLPEIKIENDSNQTRLDELINDNKFIDVMKRAFISAHAQGLGIFKVSVKNGKPLIRAVNPELYIPIYEEDDIDTIQAHVLGFIYEVYIGKGYMGEDKYEKYAKIEINEVGKVITRTYKLKDGKLSNLVSEVEETYDNWNDFLVFPFDYGKPSWREYAASQYDDVIPLIDELVVRISNNSKILDDHADPQLIVPESSLEFDANSGQHVYKRHQALKIDRDGHKPEYLTWDGSIDHSNSQIDKIMDLFYMISGTNPQMFGKDVAGNLSGDALTKIFLMPIAKTKEMILALEPMAEKSLDCAMSFLGVQDVNTNVEFDIGSFNQLDDISARVCAEVQAGVRSIDSAVRDLNPRYTEEQVSEEVKLINEQGTVDNIGNLTNDTTGEPI